MEQFYLALFKQIHFSTPDDEAISTLLLAPQMGYICTICGY
jgi:hypothetical protein